ncbi:MAG: peptidase MA family metallohydrolase [Anaerolineales bacterium]
MINKAKNAQAQIKKFFSSLILAILFSISFVQPAAGDEVDVTFGETKVENFFPDGFRFSVKIVVQHYKGRIDFYYRLGEDEWVSYPADCLQKEKDNVEYYSCVYYLNYEVLPPQLPVSYKWRLSSPVDKYSTEKTVIYENSDFEWNSLHEDKLTIWWHDHPSEFTNQILSAATTALQKEEEFYGVKLEHPIQIVILNSEDELYAWRERAKQSIGGEAFPNLGTTIQIFEEDMQGDYLEGWVNEVIPHEISHLYFAQAVGSGQTSIPRWLDEGLAGYSEFSDHSEDWGFVRQAIQQNTLIPLNQLRVDFPEGDEKVSLSYAEGTTAVIYIVEKYGQDGLNKLFSAYQAGKSSDEAFTQAFGRNLEDFEKDWQTWVVSQQKGSTNTVKILFGIIFLSTACSFILLVTIIVVIAIFNKKIKIQPVQ